MMNFGADLDFFLIFRSRYGAKIIDSCLIWCRHISQIFTDLNLKEDRSNL